MRESVTSYVRVTVFVAILPIGLILGSCRSLHVNSPANADATSSRPVASARFRPRPSLGNVPYGAHPMQVLDFWKARSDEPTPLVIYIHGGGFTTGSKAMIMKSTVRRLLRNQISVAAIEYRVISEASLPAAHRDVQRAVQFLRSNAKPWNLDKARFGGFGGSAGAQLLMFLAFHDDAADPDSDDPVARESTRLMAIAIKGGQANFDMNWWAEHIPGYNRPHRNMDRLFGKVPYEEQMQLVRSISALDNMSADDAETASIFMSYRMRPDDPLPKNEGDVLNWQVHHVNHGVVLRRRFEDVGGVAYLKYPGQKATYRTKEAYLVDKLRP